MGNPSYGTWGPMYRYSDLFDRPMRSQLENGIIFWHQKLKPKIFIFAGLDQIPSVYIQPQISSYSAFSADNQMPFVPFYSGLGKGRWKRSKPIFCTCL